MERAVDSDRLKALTDGVVAVIITIMVLDIKAPADVTIQALLSLAPVLASYILSFVYVATYWNNHHHFFVLTPKVNGAIMWANLHFLFWLSLIPFATAWAGEHEFQVIPTAVYGVVLLACSLAWYVMQTVIIRAQGEESRLQQAIGRDWKGKLSPLAHLAGICLAFIHPIASIVAYASVAAVWLIPDTRIHRQVEHKAD